MLDIKIMIMLYHFLFFFVKFIDFKVMNYKKKFTNYNLLIFMIEIRNLSVILLLIVILVNSYSNIII